MSILFDIRGRDRVLSWPGTLEAKPLDLVSSTGGQTIADKYDELEYFVKMFNVV